MLGLWLRLWLRFLWFWLARTVADDIVTLLRQHAEWLSATRTGEVCAKAADEIERLREAGNSLAQSLAEFNDPQDELRLMTWNEARRG